jgi:hypothetical protein
MAGCGEIDETVEKPRPYICVSGACVIANKWCVVSQELTLSFVPDAEQRLWRR